MGNTVYRQVLRFKEKYPMTIGWRIKQNASIVEKHLNPDEKVIYAFIAQKNDNVFNIFNSAVVALTNKRILIGRKRVIVGYFLKEVFNTFSISDFLSSFLSWPEDKWLQAIARLESLMLNLSNKDPLLPKVPLRPVFIIW